jgi:hypothetical protein
MPRTIKKELRRKGGVEDGIANKGSRGKFRPRHRPYRSMLYCGSIIMNMSQNKFATSWGLGNNHFV